MNNKHMPDSPERFRPKRYSRLTAQLIRNGVKKKIFDIRKKKSAAVNELLDDLEKKLAQNVSKYGAEGRNKTEKIINTERKTVENLQKDDENAKIYNEIAETIAEGIALADKLKGRASKAEEINVNDLLLQILSASRRDWASFLQALADNCDAEAFACFGTNLIYGGFLTETVGNTPRCRLVRLSGGSNREMAERLQNIVKQDCLSGRRVCIVVGRGLLSRELIEIYRYFNETAFILLDEDGEMPKECEVYNALYVTDGRMGSSVFPSKSAPICGIISVNDLKRPTASWDKTEGRRASKENFECDDSQKRERHAVTVGREGGARLTYGGLIDSPHPASSLFKLLSSPRLPIDLSFAELYALICELERLLSEGKNGMPLTTDI